MEKIKLYCMVACFMWNYVWAKFHRKMWEKYCHVGLNADEGSFLNTICAYGARYHIRRSRKLGNRVFEIQNLITGKDI